MYHYILTSGEEITREEAIQCPECGKEADTWNIDEWQYDEDGSRFREWTCVCFDDHEQWCFQEYKFSDE